MSDHPDAAPRSTAPVRRVRVAVLGVAGGISQATLEAIENQVYGIESVAIVGGGTEDGYESVDDFAQFVSALEQPTELVWIVHGDARPKPDALGALVAELDRNDASLVGSKVLDGADPTRLESVGSATDVFGDPYSGLDPDEVDLEQYDVVRDVAFISAVSMLVRRDLLRGLGGIDPLMAPVAAGVDLSQRARVAGGRVMVVPSSEVVHDGACDEDVPGWREQASRMRSMWKVYRVVTLAWVVPVGTLVGLVDGLARLALGQFRPLADLIRSVLWNAAVLPGSLGARRVVRSIRQVGDEELFRYQVGGSVRLRALGADFGERFGWVIDEDVAVVTEDELEDESSATGPVVAGLVAFVVALATRSFWFGSLPQSGFTLSIGDAASAMAGFAGGWNPAGLGSPDPVHPSAALLGAVEWVLGGWSGSFAVVALVSLAAAVFGTGRLLGVLGVTGPSRHLAGIVAVAGPAAAAVAPPSDVATLLAIGPTIAAVASIVAPWPAGRRAGLARAGAMVLATTVAGLLAPLAPIVIFICCVVVWALVPTIGPGSVVRGLVAADLALVAIAPYLLAVRLDDVLEGGPAYALDATLFESVFIGAAALAGIISLAGSRHRVAASGAALVALAVVTGSLEELRGDLGAAVVLTAVVGSVLVVGASIGLDRDGPGPVLAGRSIAAFAAVGLVVVASSHVVDGRAGFDVDRWSERLSFTASLSGPEEAARVLVVGPPSELPGSPRSVGGVSYRVVDASGPSLESARLPAERLGDDALESVVERIISGSLVRPGAELAPFGIGWVAVVETPQFAAAMAGQVDMDEVPVSEDLDVFRNTIDAPRAVSTAGDVWTGSGPDLVGPAGDGRVLIADNASPRWGPAWAQVDWANEVDAVDGVAAYEPDAVRRALGFVAIGLVLASAVCAATGFGSRR